MFRWSIGAQSPGAWDKACSARYGCWAACFLSWSSSPGSRVGHQRRSAPSPCSALRSERHTWGSRAPGVCSLQRLTVTGDGLVCRESSYSPRVRTTTIPWSQVTSFTVNTGASRSSDRYFVSAILTTGQQVHLAGTGRARRAAAVKIANELNAFASTTAATR